MSSESDCSVSSLESISDNEQLCQSEITPYEDEPLTDTNVGNTDNEEEEKDVDGLTPFVLEERYNGNVNIGSWCQCESCRTELLVGSLEFRCCKEVSNAVGKMVFDGSIESIKCITEHEDYGAITNRAVLKQVASLLTDKDGRKYRRRSGVSENAFLRAVAYRWTARWLCGYMGWDNTRPLPACIYQSLRTKFNSPGSTGYASSRDRE